jgi:hypothetical protein
LTPGNKASFVIMLFEGGIAGDRTTGDAPTVLGGWQCTAGWRDFENRHPHLPWRLYSRRADYQGEEIHAYVHGRRGVGRSSRALIDGIRAADWQPG